MKQYVIGWTYGTHWERRDVNRVSVDKTVRQRDLYKDLDVDGRIMFRWRLEKYGGMARIGFY